MPLDKKKIITKYTRKNRFSGELEYKPLTEPPMCGICGKRITVAELTGGQFEAIKSIGGHLAYYHATCMRMEAGGHD